MPFTVPPLRRRSFIAALAAGVSLAARWTLGSEPPAVERWGLLADSHIDVSPEKTNKDCNMAEHLVRVVGELAGRNLSDVLVLGDLAYLDGKSGDYELFCQLTKPISALGIAQHLTVGNHDHRDRFRAALAQSLPTDRPVAEREALLVRGSVCNWIILDSLYKTNVTAGEIGAAQREWLAKTLPQMDRPTLIAVHHPPQFDAKKDAVPGIQDTSELWPLLVGQPMVKAIFFGHTHDWKCSEKDGLHLVNLPPTSYPFKNERPVGWVEGEFTSSGMTLTLHTLDTQHPQHHEVQKLAWRN